MSRKVFGIIRGRASVPTSSWLASFSESLPLNSLKLCPELCITFLFRSRSILYFNVPDALSFSICNRNSSFDEDNDDSGLLPPNRNTFESESASNVSTFFPCECNCDSCLIKLCFGTNACINTTVAKNQHNTNALCRLSRLFFCCCETSIIERVPFSCLFVCLFVRLIRRESSIMRFFFVPFFPLSLSSSSSSSSSVISLFFPSSLKV